MVTLRICFNVRNLMVKLSVLPKILMYSTTFKRFHVIVYLGCGGVSSNIPKGIKRPHSAKKTSNVVSMFFVGWHVVATFEKVKQTLKQHCVRQHWNLQLWTALNQHCLFQHWCRILDSVKTLLLLLSSKIIKVGNVGNISRKWLFMKT